MKSGLPDEVVHEVRNQLAVLRANLEAFADGKIVPDQAHLRSLLQTIGELDRLVGDLRTTGPTAGAPIRAERIDVCELLSREYQAMEAVAAEEDVRLSIHRCAHVNEACSHFFGDPTRVGQIVKNVLLNALRYTPAGGSVQVDCSRAADQVQITITDSGPGIGRDESRQVFDPGFRGAASAARRGSGYGLAVVKDLVERQGGSVTFEQAAPSGARFTVRLPGTAPHDGPPSDACAHCSHAFTPPSYERNPSGLE